MTGQLSDGEVIFVVEGFYRFNMLFGGLTLGLARLLRSGQIFRR